MESNTLLSSRSKMSGFIHSLSSLGLTNCSGSAYRAVRLCYFKAGILLVDYHHVDNSCSIFICSDPHTEIQAGCQSSTTSGNAMPKPKNGELIEVWRNGKWIKDGPWVVKIILFLAELIEKKENKIEETARENAEKVKAESQAREDHNKRLTEAWGNV